MRDEYDRTSCLGCQHVSSAQDTEDCIIRWERLQTLGELTAPALYLSFSSPWNRSFEWTSIPFSADWVQKWVMSALYPNVKMRAFVTSLGRRSFGQNIDCWPTGFVQVCVLSPFKPWTNTILIGNQYRLHQSPKFAIYPKGNLLNVGKLWFMEF